MKRFVARFGVAVLFVAHVSAQTTWYVDINGIPPGSGTQVDPYTSIQYAISRPATLPGDTVLVLPGDYREAVNYIGKSLTLRSTQGASLTCIDAAKTGAAVKVTVGVQAVLEGFRVERGTGTSYNNAFRGGGVFCIDSTLRITDCVITRSAAEIGGGLYLSNSNVTIEGTLVIANTAETAPGLLDGIGGGLAIDASSTVVLREVQVTDNGAAVGGGLHASGGVQLTCEDGTISGNLAEGDFNTGGGAHFDGSSATFSNVAFLNNQASGYSSFGGGLYIGSGAVNVLSCAFQGNTAGDRGFDIPGFGGGIATSATPVLVVEDSVFIDNVGWLGGGGAYGIGEYRSCRFEQCESQFGGAFHGLSLAARLIGCVLESNDADSPSGTSHFGGGVHGPAFLDSCRLADNFAWGEGGGAYDCTIHNSELIDNEASWPDNYIDALGGGAAFSTLTNSVVSGNLVCGASDLERGLGGGLYACDATDCEITGNRADAGGGAFASTLTRCVVARNIAAGNPGFLGTGGGADASTLVRTLVYDNDGERGGGVAHSDLDRCTVADNRATLAGGGAHGSGAIDSAILWSNLPDQLGAGGSFIVAYSDIEGSWPGTGNISADPVFWRVQSGDYFLQAMSPCIDTGNPSAPLDPDGSRADMGAHPFDPAHLPEPWVYCTAKMNSCGGLPAIGYAGVPSASATSGFFVDAKQAKTNRVGLLIYNAGGTAAIPFQGGTLCIDVTSVQRSLQLISIGGTPNLCDALLEIDMNAFAAGLLGGHPAAFLRLPGQRVNVQWWGRDTPANGSLLSDALEYYVGP